MTNEEAKHKLDFMKKAYQKLIDEKVDSGKLVGDGVRGEWQATTPLDEAYKDMIEGLDLAIQALEQQSSEDCVSRSDVMVLIEDTNLKHLSFKRGISQKAFEDLLNGTQSLPSVIPQPKIGHWIIEEVKDEDGRPYDIKYFCSECQAERPPIWDDYCSACGAKMEVEDKESEE